MKCQSSSLQKKLKEMNRNEDDRQFDLWIARRYFIAINTTNKYLRFFCVICVYLTRIQLQKRHNKQGRTVRIFLTLHYDWIISSSQVHSDLPWDRSRRSSTAAHRTVASIFIFNCAGMSVWCPAPVDRIRVIHVPVMALSNTLYWPRQLPQARLIALHLCWTLSPDKSRVNCQRYNLQVCLNTWMTC